MIKRLLSLRIKPKVNSYIDAKTWIQKVLLEKNMEKLILISLDTKSNTHSSTNTK